MQSSKLQYIALCSKVQNYLIVLVFFVALFLRVYKVAEYPAGLNADEAAIGYNAYSLIQTGKDEFGHPWPINFQSFNDFKPGLYFYLVLPFVKILGLNELAVRLPSAILGSLTVIILYFLVYELFNSKLLALSSSLLLAVSPWHLHFSRGGWETNMATLFIVLGIWFFFVSLRKPKYFVFCTLTFALSMFTYHSARVVVPLFALGFILFYGKKIFVRANFRWLAIAFLTGIIPVTVLIFSFLKQEGTSRFSGVGLFADKGPFWRVNELRGQHTNPFSGFPKIIHNKYFEYGVQFLDNYLRHFNGNFLFIDGDEIQRNRVPEMGQLYLAEFPFLILGFFFLFKRRPKNWQFVLWWLAIAPVASALTFQSPHAIRALNMVVPLVFLTAYGICNVLVWTREQKRLITIFLYCYIFISFGWNFSFYLHQYYVHYPQTYPAAWEYGFRELVEYVKNNQEKYKKIYVTSKYDQPYILFAFYLRYPPEKFQKEAGLTARDQYGFSTVENFGKYHFGPVSLKNTPKEGKTMIIGTPIEIPESAKIVKRIYFKDGRTEAFRITEN